MRIVIITFSLMWRVFYAISTLALAFLVLAVLTAPAVVYHALTVVRRGEEAVHGYSFAVLTGIDRLAGGVLFGSDSLSASSVIHRHASNGNRHAKLLEKMIDALAGCDWCASAWYNETAFNSHLNDDKKE